MRAVALVVLVGAIPVASALQPQAGQPATQTRDSPRAGAGVIGGRVTDREGGQPLAGVSVTLGGPPNGSLGGKPVVTHTGPDGRYAFARLGPGPYSLTFAPPAHSATHLPHVYGERQPLRPRFRRPYSISLRNGERLENADVALWRALAIGGRVTDEHGTPLVNVTVHAFTMAGLQSSSDDTSRASDDRGAFRIFGLQPGKYLICAEPRTDPATFWQPMHAGLPSTGAADPPERPIRTCHLSAANDTDAQPVSLATADVDGIEIRLRRSRTFTARGAILTASGEPFQESRPQVSVMRLERRPTPPARLELMPGGGFVARGLTPGEYVVAVDRYGASLDSPERETARVPFRVESSDIDGLVVVMQRPAKVTGRVVFEGTPPAARFLTGMRIGTMAASRAPGALGGPMSDADVTDDLSFELIGLFGPQLVTMRGLPRDYYVRRVSYRGQDITDTPIDFKGAGDSDALEILLSNRGAFVTGTVLDAQGSRADDAVVLVFSADPERWRSPGGIEVRLLVPPKGPYTVGPLRAGQYLVVALHGEDSDVYSAGPEMLEALAPAAERVVLGESERRTLDLRITTLR